MDLLLTRDGDMLVTDNGDLRVDDSVLQKILIRIRWFLSEWRWNTNEGLPYWERLLKKNPDTDLFISDMRSKILEVSEVKRVDELKYEIDAKTRECKIRFVARTDRDIVLREEVVIDARLWSD